jgi:hypothetical protein
MFRGKRFDTAVAIPRQYPRDCSGLDEEMPEHRALRMAITKPDDDACAINDESSR